MGKRRQFTNEFKLEAVKLAEEDTVSVAPMGRELDRRQTILRREARRFVSTRVRDQIGSILSDDCSRPGGLAACFAISLGSNILNVLAFIPAALALGERLPALSICLAGPLIILANSLPISPGGVGVAESTSHALLDGFAYGAEVMLLLRAAIVVSALPGAAFYAMHAGRAKQGA